MITNTSHFRGYADQIMNLIDAYSEPVSFSKVGRIVNFTTDNIISNYNSVFKRFPFHTEDATAHISISKYAFGLFELFANIDSRGEKIHAESLSSVKNLMSNKVNIEADKFILSDFFEELIHNLIFNYGEFLANTKALHFFEGIESEEVILKNLLNHYKNILTNPEIQLRHFQNSDLTKEISDIITSVLIDFINHRLSVLSPPEGSKNDTPLGRTSHEHRKIEWLGEQQELNELFYELEMKGWIPKTPSGQRQAVAKSITSFFNLENTKRKDDSNPDKSFQQSFKGDNEEGKRVFNFMKSKNYVRKFDQIQKSSS